MRYYPIVVGVAIVTYFVTCGTFESNRSARKLTSEQNVIVLKPVEAVVNAKVDPPLESIEIRIKQKKGEAFEFKHAQFVNDKTGWAMTNKSVYKTSDGGNKWDRLGVTPQEDASFTSFHFIDDYRGWLTEHKRVYVEQYGLGHSSRILITNDGGITWQPQANFQNEVILFDIRFLSTNEGLAIGAKAIEHKPVYWELLVLNTTNGGASWNDISKKVKVAIENKHGVANDVGRYIHWTSSSSVFLLTKYGNVIGTTDSGVTWKRIASFQVERPHSFLMPTGYFKLLLDPQEKLRVLAGGMGDEGYWGDLVVKGDDGSWTTNELSRIPLLDAVYLTGNHIIASGEEHRIKTEQAPASYAGVILRSLDGGKSWSRMYSSKSGEQFFYLTRIDAKRFYAVSDIGTFLRFSMRDN